MRLAPTRLVPFSYFWTCWKVRPNASPSFSWLMPSMMRRMRTRLPTYLSTGFGALVDISNTPWDYAGDEAKQSCSMPQAAVPSNPARRVGRKADNGSNAVTESVLGCEDRMRTTASVCQPVDFRLPVFRPQHPDMHSLPSGRTLRDPPPNHENQCDDNESCGRNTGRRKSTG